MSLFDKFQQIQTTLAALEQSSVMPVGACISKLYSATEGDIAGRRVVLAGTNNYLGLTFHPEVLSRAADALKSFGSGSTGSRMASGTYSGHLALEEELAAFLGKEQAIVFTTGYQANLGIISTLAGPDDCIILDADSHASIYDGAKMSGAQVFRFKHNNTEDLAKRLLRVPNTDRCLIIIEGLYSMLGDRAPLADLIAVKKELGGYLLLDEAHSLGVLGPGGRGLAAEAGLIDEVDFLLGTFSKSLGCIGGYCASSLPQMAWVRSDIRAYMFTASGTPATIATARAALAIMAREGDQLRMQLNRSATRVFETLNDLGFQTGAEAGPVVATLMNSPQQALEAWQTLLDEGVYVNLVVPPASPGTLSLLRCSLSAAHTEAQIDHILAAYKTVGQRIGLNQRPTSSDYQEALS